MRLTQICFGEVGAEHREGFLVHREGGVAIFRSLRGKQPVRAADDSRRELCRKESEVNGNGKKHAAAFAD